MHRLDVIVKREYNSKDNIMHPIMFYVVYNKGRPCLECFTFKDGHNVSSVDFLASLWDCAKEDQQNFVDSVQKYYDSLPCGNAKLVLKDVLIIE